MSTQKNLVALAVSAIVAASATAAFAGGVKTARTGGSISSQYVAAVAAASTSSARQVALSDLGTSAWTIKLNAEYALNDKITIGFPCGCLVDTTLPSTIQTDNVGGQQLTFALLSSSASSATYRVTNRLDATASTRNLVIGNGAGGLGLADIKLNLAAVSGSVSTTFSASTSSGDAFDTSLTFNPADTTYGTSATLVSVANQFSGEVPTGGLLDGVIDVNPSGAVVPLTRFTSGATSDVFTVRTFTASSATTLAATTFAKTADVSAVTYTLSGDFSWATAAKKDEVFLPACPTNSTLAETTTLVNTATGSFSWTCLGTNAVGASAGSTAAGTNGTSTLTIVAGAQGAVLPTTTFTYGSTVSYFSPSGQSGANGSVTTQARAAAGTAAGAWTINGAQIFVPYMPYGSTIDQVIYLANKSGVTGDISVQYIGTDTTAVVNLGKIGTINGRSTLNISPLIKAALPAAAQASGRLAFIITVNAPVADVDVLASYRIGDDRAFVQTRKLN